MLLAWIRLSKMIFLLHLGGLGDFPEPSVAVSSPKQASTLTGVLDSPRLRVDRLFFSKTEVRGSGSLAPVELGKMKKVGFTGLVQYFQLFLLFRLWKY